MSYVTEQMIFDHFQECNRKLTIDDLYERFEGVRLDSILKAVHALVNKRLLDEQDNGQAFTLSEKAKVSIQEDIEKTKRESERQDMELEKTKTDLALAKKLLKEYPYTKWTARLGFLIALGLAILEMVKLLTGKE